MKNNCKLVIQKIAEDYKNKKFYLIKVFFRAIISSRLMAPKESWKHIFFTFLCILLLYSCTKQKCDKYIDRNPPTYIISSYIVYTYIVFQIKFINQSEKIYLYILLYRSYVVNSLIFKLQIIYISHITCAV